ncbi:hypothetical protein MSAN_01186500 [Mycena sanguinolenta]|uniref:Uncharacterized protein n=1 Tax=Mycena sanguinolenta TaxID=230812 RepID=A0A8H6YM40_9AGAR|nr:hypothetical protein MSAN_01186500 [Mycena sanguinolenta]
MRFNFSLFSSVFAALALNRAVTAQSCDEAARFGVLSVTPSTLAQGDSFTVHVDLACAQQLGYLPTYMDYYIEVLSNNNGYEAPILLARRTYDPATVTPADTFTAQLPDWYYFADAQYSVVFVNSFAKPGPTNNSVITQGEVYTPINITGI